MALTQPILYTKSAFDAAKQQTFEFNVIGGNQVVANKLTIKDNATLSTVYESTQNTFAFQHIVAANSLSNNEYYQAYIVTYDANGNESVASNIIEFNCYTEPSFEFTNIPSTGIISNSSFSFEVEYNQDEDEPLAQYTFNLYDIAGRLLNTSGVIYTGSTVVPLAINYTFGGFVNNSIYQIECVGKTLSGTIISTALETIDISYAKPSSYVQLELTNNCDGGYIYVQSNATAILGISQPDPPIYIDGEKVSLLNNGDYVEWAQGFEINNNWTLGIWAEHFTPNQTYAVLSNADGSEITITGEQSNSTFRIRLTVKAPTSQFGYVIYSNSIVLPDVTDTINIWVRRIDNIYEVKLANLE